MPLIVSSGSALSSSTLGMPNDTNGESFAPDSDSSMNKSTGVLARKLSRSVLSVQYAVKLPLTFTGPWKCFGIYGEPITGSPET